MRNVKSKMVYIICALLLILVGGTVSHAAISKPKNFRIQFVSEKGDVLEKFEYSVYAVQQVFLDKLNTKTYIDPKGYEYNVTGFRLQTWPGQNYTGKAGDDVPMSYDGVVAALRRAYDTLDTPYSLQASLVLRATGNRYATAIPIHVIWLNQDSEFVKEEIQELGRDNYYTDTPPKDYEIISVSATMTDIWKVGSEITVDEKSPTVYYNKFAEEYRIVYRLQLTKEQEAEIMGLLPESSDEGTGESESGTGETPGEPIVSTAEETTAPFETAVPVSTSEGQETEQTEPESAVIPTQTDESFRTGSGKTTLIIGLVIGIAVIYLIVISIGTNSKKKNTKRKTRL